MVLRISTRARSKNCLYCLELHRTFFFKNWKWAYIFLIGRKRTNQNACAHAWLAAMSKPVQSKKSQRLKLTNVCHSEMISCVRIHTMTSYIYEVIYIFRLQLPVKFVNNCSAACCLSFSRRGKKKTGAQQIFSPARAVDKFEKSAMCTIPNSDVPTLLGRQPNTSLAFE